MDAIHGLIEKHELKPDEQTRDDELRGHLYQTGVRIRHKLEQSELGHSLATGCVNNWLAEHVLCMIAGSDDLNGLPEAASGIIARDEAIAQVNLILSRHRLPPIPYNLATDTVELCYEPSDAMGHRYYGFAPLGTDLSYEREVSPSTSGRSRSTGSQSTRRVRFKTLRRQCYGDDVSLYSLEMAGRLH